MLEDYSIAEQLATALAYGYLSSGSFDMAIKTAHLIPEIAAKLFDPRIKVRAQMTLGIIHEHAGHLDLARSIRKKQILAVDDADSPLMSAELHLVKAYMALEDGDLVTCDASIQKARKGFLANGGGRMLGFVAIHEAQLLEKSGDPLRARELLMNILRDNESDIGHSAAASARDQLAGIDLRIGEIELAAREIEAARVLRLSVGSVESPREKGLLAPIKREINERLSRPKNY